MPVHIMYMYIHTYDSLLWNIAITTLMHGKLYENECMCSAETIYQEGMYEDVVYISFVFVSKSQKHPC